MLGRWPFFFHFILRQLCLLSHDFCKQQNTKIKKKLFAFWMTYFYLLSNFASNVNPNIYSFDGTCIINLHAHSFYCTAFVLYLLIDQKKYNYYGKACNVGWIVYEKESNVMRRRMKGKSRFYSRNETNKMSQFRSVCPVLRCVSVLVSVIPAGKQ